MIFNYYCIVPLILFLRLQEITGVPNLAKGRLPCDVCGPGSGYDCSKKPDPRQDASRDITICVSKYDLKPSGGVEIRERAYHYFVSQPKEIGCGHPPIKDGDPTLDTTKWECYCNEIRLEHSCNEPLNCYVCDDCQRARHFEPCKYEQDDGRVSFCTIQVNKDGTVVRGCEEGRIDSETPECKDWDGSDGGKCACDGQLCNDMIFFQGPKGFSSNGTTPSSSSTFRGSAVLTFLVLWIFTANRKLLLAFSLFLVASQFSLVQSQTPVMKCLSLTCSSSTPPKDCSIGKATEVDCGSNFLCVKEYTLKDNKETQLTRLGCDHYNKFYRDFDHFYKIPDRGNNRPPGEIDDVTVAVSCKTEKCNGVLNCHQCDDDDCSRLGGKTSTPCPPSAEDKLQYCFIKVIDWVGGGVERGCSDKFMRSPRRTCKEWNGEDDHCVCFHDGCNFRTFSNLNVFRDNKQDKKSGVSRTKGNAKIVMIPVVIAILCYV